MDDCAKLPPAAGRIAAAPFLTLRIPSRLAISHPKYPAALLSRSARLGPSSLGGRCSPPRSLLRTCSYVEHAGPNGCGPRISGKPAGSSSHIHFPIILVPAGMHPHLRSFISSFPFRIHFPKSPTGREAKTLNWPILPARMRPLSATYRWPPGIYSIPRTSQTFGRLRGCLRSPNRTVSPEDARCL